MQLMLMLASGILSCQLEDFGSDVLHRGGQVRFSLQPPAPELNILGPPCFASPPILFISKDHHSSSRDLGSSKQLFTCGVSITEC